METPIKQQQTYQKNFDVTSRQTKTTAASANGFKTEKIFKSKIAFSEKPKTIKKSLNDN